MGRRKKRVAKKTRQIQLQRGEDEDLKTAPHTFVIHRGKVGRSVINLVQNFRRVMAPYTAEKLKVNNKNILKDFISIAGPLNVSHMVMFSKTDVSVNLRICRLPRGPTLNFQVDSYSLIHDLAHHVRKHDVNDSHFKHHALLVMNNFSKDVNHLKLTASMFQNMFPSINVNKVLLKKIKRVALVSYDAESDHIEFRHYHLRVVPLGVSRSIRKLQKKTIPRLDKYDDISQFLLNPGVLSESEAEQDGEHNSVELPQKLSGSANTQNEQSAIRLKEIGPRMTLTLTKITDGVCAGDVLYYKYDTLTEEQKKEIQIKREEKMKLKAQRTAEQNERIRLKKAAKEASQQKTQRKQHQQQQQLSTKDSSSDLHADDGGDVYNYGDAQENDVSEDDESDDAKYYEMEVGSKPDKGLFSNQSTRKKRSTGKNSREVSAPKSKLRKMAGNRSKAPKAKMQRKSKAKAKGTIVTSKARKVFSGGAKFNRK